MYDTSNKLFQLQSKSHPASFLPRGYLSLPLGYIRLTNFHQIGPSVQGVLSFCSKGSASLNTMAAMPIYGKKTLKIFISKTKKASRLNLVTEHWGLEFIQVCSNDDPRLTFDLFLRQGKKLRPYEFVWGRYLKFSFSECIKDQWLKLTMYDQSSKQF